MSIKSSHGSARHLAEPLASGLLCERRAGRMRDIAYEPEAATCLESLGSEIRPPIVQPLPV
jgi:hypothetical protein